MATLDNLLSKAKVLAKAAGSKTEEVVDLTRFRLQASQLKTNIDANYQKLGEIIYELKTSSTENDELVNMCVAEIGAQLRELEELKAKIQEMKNAVKCPECSASNVLGASYCAFCGAALKVRPVAAQDSPGDAAAGTDNQEP